MSKYSPNPSAQKSAQNYKKRCFWGSGSINALTLKGQPHILVYQNLKFLYIFQKSREMAWGDRGSLPRCPRHLPEITLASPDTMWASSAQPSRVCRHAMRLAREPCQPVRNPQSDCPTDHPGPSRRGATMRARHLSGSVGCLERRACLPCLPKSPRCLA